MKHRIAKINDDLFYALDGDEIIMAHKTFAEAMKACVVNKKWKMAKGPPEPYVPPTYNIVWEDEEIGP